MNSFTAAASSPRPRRVDETVYTATHTHTHTHTHVINGSSSNGYDYINE